MILVETLIWDGTFRSHFLQSRGVDKLVSQSLNLILFFFSDLFLVEVTNDGQSDVGTALHSELLRRGKLAEIWWRLSSSSSSNHLRIC
jgi:hypothetical protein